MEMKIFNDFDFSDFWEDEIYDHGYSGPEPSDELILTIEKELGYKFPASYIEFMKFQNGGTPLKNSFPTTPEKHWDEYREISGFFGIGRNNEHTLCGEYGNKFWIEEWGYPNIGVYIGDGISGGHELILLDYSNCGKDGEPEVVYIDQELDYRKTFVAKDFETFVRELVNPDVFEEYENCDEEFVYDYSENKIHQAIDIIKNGRFSNDLIMHFNGSTINFETILRNLFSEYIQKHGHFDFEYDDLTFLILDIQFFLLTWNKSIKSKDDYVKHCISMIANKKDEISLGGDAVQHMENWFDHRVKSGDIKRKLFRGFKFTPAFERVFLKYIEKYEQ